jgi:hypothetical protein
LLAVRVRQHDRGERFSKGHSVGPADRPRGSHEACPTWHR